MRHSTLLPWLQNGQQKTVSSLSIRFLGGGFALDFLFPMVQLKKLVSLNITDTLKSKLGAPHFNSGFKAVCCKQ